ncbi:DEAD/DEAH box helicase family protein [bacterium]|nr:DEAD/DEAH box helicase family protein [bacterium]MBU1065423.1 DEAD/DEAH box helicase family protein [bacterium]MBU1633529.1 DEAD/DEAH box helicase family protein [bacterium]MBU1874991.1 DEAD/DEAH box helicase family protein [bacterium]
MSKEAKARIKINQLLEEAGWRFFDNEKGPANIQLETTVKYKPEDVENGFEGLENISKYGHTDYLLLDQEGFPFVVLEAKAENIHPLSAKEQARKYADNLKARYVILSNGDTHYLWDIHLSNPIPITRLPGQESLLSKRNFRPNPAEIIRELVNQDYVILTQKPDYRQDPRWYAETRRENYLADSGLMLLRPYQIRAVQSIQNEVRAGKQRFLFEMATGTGKTLIAAAVIRLFLRTRNAKRILFLVDRLELEDQAWKAFHHYLRNDFQSVIFKYNREDWRKAEIVISTIQTLMVGDKYRRIFSPTDFDLVISDEAHRSIGGNSRAVFEYFVGYKLGLTATPKDYLKNIENLDERDSREVERRILLDTYQTFGCESGDPTFRYSLLDGVKEGYLVSPVVIDARTEITTKLLSDEGYSILTKDEEGNDVEKIFVHRDFERKFFSRKTNTAFCKAFMENAQKDPFTGETGKSIVFCVSQNHAAKVTGILNELAMQMYPGKYKSDFAIQVTSRIKNAQQFTINFANNRLRGHSNWLDGYKTSKARVCVTVGMMTTGYDCRDILNLGLMRPIFSPTDFVQIKGRGTRKYTFTHKERNSIGDMEEYRKAKEGFTIFDYFANFEYFEEQYDYDQVLKIPLEADGKPGQEPPQQFITHISKKEDYIIQAKDISISEWKIDYMMWGHFSDRIRSDEFIVESIARGDYQAAEDYIIQEMFDKPTEHITLEKLRKAANVDRPITLRELIEHIFGFIPKLKSRKELLEEETDKFISIYHPDPGLIIPIKHILNAYISDAEIRKIIDAREYAKLATTSIIEDFRALTPEYRELIPRYVKDYIQL